MKYAKGGYIPRRGPRGADVPIRLNPSEKLISRDGRIWQVTDDGERIELIRGPREGDD